MGCFWGAERIFWQLDGVYSTFVGYAGGFTPNCTYEENCTGLTGHAEVVGIVFDPQVISFERIMQVFWESHDPTQEMRQGNDIGSHYRTAVYATQADQLPVIEATRATFQAQLDAEEVRHDHHRGQTDRLRPRLLLRRAVSPAVPRQEPERLLRNRRHGCQLSDRTRRLRHTVT